MLSVIEVTGICFLAVGDFNAFFIGEEALDGFTGVFGREWVSYALLPVIFSGVILGPLTFWLYYPFKR